MSKNMSREWRKNDKRGFARDRRSFLVKLKFISVFYFFFSKKILFFILFLVVYYFVRYFVFFVIFDIFFDKCF